MSENKVQSYLFGDYQLQIENCQLLKEDNPVSLTQKSFEVLLYLVENRGRILKKEELLDNLWEGNYVEEANLTQHIYMLRKALKQNGGKDKYIETIPKNGYRFVAEVEEQIKPILLNFKIRGFILRLAD
jgi:DNA-binding winged helix-turn-helix (wHTH) protein